VVDCAGATKASMLQDVERGANTEVDVINGAIVAQARKLGRDAPLNAGIVTFVHRFERGHSVPSPDLFLQLRVGQDATVRSGGDTSARDA
jgi:2-dehydropantoate 2-reductase